MLKENSLSEFREKLLLSGGRIMWENEFSSWTDQKQRELIAYIHGFIIYTQTDLGFLQAPWIAFEHGFSYNIQRFANIANKYYIKALGESSHTVIQLYPKNLFELLADISRSVQVHKRFREVPHYRLFHFLNRTELLKYNNDEEKVMEITLNKLRAANLNEYVSTVMFVPEPKYYEI